MRISDWSSDVCSSDLGKRGGGEETEWVTIAPVAEAIDVLERLSARAGQARGTTTLWPVLTLRANTKTHVSAEIVRQLNRFRDHLNDHFGSAQAPVIPAGPDGRPWRSPTRQFRPPITTTEELRAGKSGVSPGVSR